MILVLTHTWVATPTIARRGGIEMAKETNHNHENKKGKRLQGMGWFTDEVADRLLYEYPEASYHDLIEQFERSFEMSLRWKMLNG